MDDVSVTALPVPLLKSLHLHYERVCEPVVLMEMDNSELSSASFSSQSV